MCSPCTGEYCRKEYRFYRRFSFCVINTRTRCGVHSCRSGATIVIEFQSNVSIFCRHRCIGSIVDRIVRYSVI